MFCVNSTLRYCKSSSCGSFEAKHPKRYQNGFLTPKRYNYLSSLAKFAAPIFVIRKKGLLNKINDAWLLQYLSNNMKWSHIIISSEINWEKVMAQWWELLTLTNVARVQFQPSALLRELYFGFSVFLPPQKTNISKFQFDQDRGPAWKPAKADMAYIVIY